MWLRLLFLVWLGQGQAQMVEEYKRGIGVEWYVRHGKTSSQKEPYCTTQPGMEMSKHETSIRNISDLCSVHLLAI